MLTRRQILALLTFLEDEPLTLARVELEDMLRDARIVARTA